MIGRYASNHLSVGPNLEAHAHPLVQTCRRLCIPSLLTLPLNDQSTICRMGVRNLSNSQLTNVLYPQDKEAMGHHRLLIQRRPWSIPKAASLRHGQTIQCQL